MLTKTLNKCIHQQCLHAAVTRKTHRKVIKCVPSLLLLQVTLSPTYIQFLGTEETTSMR